MLDRDDQQRGRARAALPDRKVRAASDSAPPQPEASTPPTGAGEPAGAEGPSSEQLAGLWLELQTALRRRLKKEQFETWFRRAALVRADEQGVELAVQNSFARDWLRNNYFEALLEAVREIFGEGRLVEIAVDPELTAAACPRAEVEGAESPATAGDDQGSTPGAGTAPAPPSPGSSSTGRGLLWASDVTLNRHYTFDNFVVGPCNRFAHAASVGVSEAPGKAYNPYFLHGNVGLGKTHLLQSLCFSLLDREPQTRILYLSCETFVNHFIGALENGDLQKFRHKYRNVDVLVVDDIHMLANKERTQEEFFHTFNTLYNAGKQIVLSSDSPPKEIPTLQDRLVSRFKWGLVTEIESPCYETRMAIVKRKSKERGHELPDDVAGLVAEHLDTNIRELEGAVTRVIGYASLSGQEVTVDLCRKVLRDVFTVQRGEPSMDDILKIVTAHFGVRVTDLQSRKRTKAIAHPRQVSMYLARKITRHSLEEVGGFFGGRDHSTVLYAVGQIEKEIQRDERFRALIADFLGQLQGR